MLTSVVDCKLFLYTLGSTIYIAVVICHKLRTFAEVRNACTCVQFLFVKEFHF